MCVCVCVCAPLLLLHNNKSPVPTYTHFRPYDCAMVTKEQFVWLKTVAYSNTEQQAILSLILWQHPLKAKHHCFWLKHKILKTQSTDNNNFISESMKWLIIHTHHVAGRKRSWTSVMWCCSDHTGSSSYGRTFPPRSAFPWRKHDGRRNNTHRCRPYSQETPFENPTGERSKVKNQVMMINMGNYSCQDRT